MENKSQKKRAELLAPAGTFTHLRAAVNSGADAVYIGGSRWSARAGAGNFNDEEMEKAASYCRLRNVKLYTAVNTLIFDDEMEEALEYAKFLYQIGIDALIVQDFGFAARVKECLPDFSLHLSTQGTIYSREGVLAASELGFERVVLAREVPLSEILEIKKVLEAECKRTELETFVHGALCFCFSGQCQMSRMRGGRSGNRGVCAQPCRLPYLVQNRQTKHLLSPKDLCTVDMLSELLEAGVFSLKIEGRMKSPEYVAIVTAIYRKYLDLYLRDGFYRVTEEDRRALNQIFNRGGFTEGYLHGNPDSRLISGSLPKHQGIKIGEVVRRSRGEIVEVVLKQGETLNIGDGVEIRNEELPGNIVTYLKEPALSQRQEQRKTSGRRLFIGDIRGSVHSGDELYRITEKALMEQARRTYALDKDGRELMVRRSAVTMRFTARLGEHAVLTVWQEGKENGGEGERENLTDGDSFKRMISVSVYSEQKTEVARTKPLTEERLRAQLSKAGSSVFLPEKIEVILEGSLSMPMASVNAMRRKALMLLEDQKEKEGLRRLPERCASGKGGQGKEERSNGSSQTEKAKRSICLYVHVWNEKTAGEIEKAARIFCSAELSHKDSIRACRRREAVLQDALYTIVLLPLKVYFERYLLEPELQKQLEKYTVMPYLSSVSMGKEDLYVREHFDEIVRQLRTKPDISIVCGNLGWLSAFIKQGVSAVAGFGLNAANWDSVRFWKKLGAVSVMPSLELIKTVRFSDSGFSVIDETDGSEAAIESNFYGFGAVPLMISEHLLDEQDFIGKKGEHYCRIINEYGDKSLIFEKGHFHTLMLLMEKGAVI